MTVVLRIGRRVPRNYLKRQLQKSRNLLTFQQHAWLMIHQALNLMRKRANASDTGIKVAKVNSQEVEDLHSMIEWTEVYITGSPEQEQEEYAEALDFYKDFKKVFKKESSLEEKSDLLGVKKMFKTTKLDAKQLDEAYSKGMGSVSDDNIANKLLEMGILTHVELKEDYVERGVVVQGEQETS